MIRGQQPTFHTLRLGVRSVDCILDRAGTPFPDAHLHPEFAEALLSNADTGHPHTLAIELGVPAGDASRTAEVQETLRGYFRLESERAARELRSLRSRGLRSLFVALLVIAAVVAISEAVAHWHHGRLATIISESLVIIAWVTMWGPAEALIIDRIPIRRRCRISRLLAASNVSLIPRANPQ